VILVIDNYDSFTYNLVQYLGELGANLHIARNDEITIEEIEALDPDRILISPGSCEVVRVFGFRKPLFGVCLGHQCVGQVYGGTVVRAARLMHGKTSEIYHDGAGVLQEMPNPFAATRYHSLIVERDTLPEVLAVTAETAEKEIMGLQHLSHPVYGVQFHPESILTEDGKRILKNFMVL